MKDNLVLQLVLIPLLAASLVSYLTVGSWFDFSYFPLNNLLAFGATITVLLLLVRPKTRDQFHSVKQ
jgi:hypothetical protein